MQKFEGFTTGAWYYTEDAAEIPPHISAEMVREALLDFSAEPLVAACWVDQLLSRGKIFVVVTERRVVARHLALTESAFADLSSIERTHDGNVVLVNQGNKCELFAMRPPKALMDRVYQVVVWRRDALREARDSGRAQAAAPILSCSFCGSAIPSGFECSKCGASAPAAPSPPARSSAPPPALVRLPAPVSPVPGPQVMRKTAEGAAKGAMVVAVGCAGMLALCIGLSIVVRVVEAVTSSTPAAAPSDESIPESETSGSVVVRNDATGAMERVRLPRFEIVSRRATDNPGKAQVEVVLVVTSGITRRGLDQLLRQVHAEAKTQHDGLTVHDHFSHVAVRAYTPDQRIGDDLPLGNLLAIQDGGPEITFNDALLARIEANRGSPVGVGDADVFLAHGSAKLNANDVDGAIKDLVAATTLNPRHVRAHFELGNARLMKGDYAGAQGSYDVVLRLDPGRLVARTNRGLARRAVGNARGALEDFEAAMGDGDPAEAHYNRGTARHDLGDLRGAVADYSETIRLKPDHTNAYYERGRATKGLGDDRAAALDWEQSLRLSPRQDGHEDMRTFVLGALGRPSRH